MQAKLAAARGDLDEARRELAALALAEDSGATFGAATIHLAMAEAAHAQRDH
jgi:hypothetical protein